MTVENGQQNRGFAQVATRGGESFAPEKTWDSSKPLCDSYGRLIIVIDGVMSTTPSAGESMDTTTWLGTSLNAGIARTGPEGFHNVIPVASSDVVSAVTKIFGYNNAATPGYVQLWFSNDTTPGSGSKELALVQPVAAFGSFNVDAFIPFHVFGGTLWLYMVLVLSSDPLQLVPAAVDSLWATWNYISKSPYP